MQRAGPERARNLSRVLMAEKGSGGNSVQVGIDREGL